MKGCRCGCENKCKVCCLFNKFTPTHPELAVLMDRAQDQQPIKENIIGKNKGTQLYNKNKEEKTGKFHLYTHTEIHNIRHIYVDAMSRTLGIFATN